MSQHGASSVIQITPSLDRHESLLFITVPAVNLTQSKILNHAIHHHATANEIIRERKARWPAKVTYLQKLEYHGVFAANCL